MRAPRFLRRAATAVREYVTLFLDGEADVEDYVLMVLLATYAFILFFHAVAP